MQRSEAEIRDLFHTRGLRHTRQREILYAALASTKSHPTAEELFTLVQDADPGLSLATVYNALDAFEQHSLCRRLPTGAPGGAFRYDADLADHAHVVTADGRIFDVPADLHAQLRERLGDSFFVELEARTGIKLGQPSVQFVASV